MARNRPRRPASRRDTAHGGSPGERKVYITEEFDSTPGTWPRPLSYLGKYAWPTGRHAAACACRSYYSLLRNWRSRVSTDHPRLWGVSRQLGPRFPPLISSELPAFCGGQDKIISPVGSTFGMRFLFSLNFRVRLVVSCVNNVAYIVPASLVLLMDCIW